MSETVWFTCAACGMDYPDTSFHVITGSGRCYCEKCLFNAMMKQKGAENV